MRYLANCGVSLSIWAIDPGTQQEPCNRQINLFIRAPGEASVGRLLQYVHWQASQQATCPEIDPVQKFHLTFKGTSLDLEQVVKEIEPDAVGALTLKMERVTVHTGSALNLDYTPDDDFGYTNVELQVNVLSSDKILTRTESKAKWDTTLARLKKLATNMLNEYEACNPTNICTCREHTVDDLVGFDLLGRSNPTPLNSDDSNNDLRLGDLLAIDFAPSATGSCCVMFRTQHNQLSENGVTITFISEAQLSMNKMAIDPNTTVSDVKEFICTVYGHALRLTNADVKLIYKGHLLRDTNSSGQLSKVLDYISETQGAKVHVQINQEYTEPGPGFWSELFNNSDRFSFMNRSLSENTQNTQTPDLAQQPILPTQETAQNLFTEAEFVTETGALIERTGQVFEKVVISGQESFVKTSSFEPTSTFIELNDQQIEVFPDEVAELRGVVLLSQRLISRIETSYGVKVSAQLANHVPWTLLQNNATQEPALDENVSDLADGPAEADEVGRIARIRQWTRTIMRTIYLIIRNSVFYFVIFFQVTAYVRSLYLFVGTGLILLKTIWSTSEIWEIWGELLWPGQEEKLNEGEIQQLQEIYRGGDLSRSFYSRFANSPAITEALIERLRGNNDLKLKLIRAFKMDPQDSLQIMVPKLLEECNSTQHDEVDISPLRELFDPFMHEIVEYLEDIPRLNAVNKGILAEYRRYVYQRSALPWYRSATLWLSDVYDKINNGAFIRALVQGDRRRLRGFRLLQRGIVDFLRLVTLFLLILVPRFQRQTLLEVNRLTAQYRD
ncbi:LADA_0G08108g1_1 [Lachancea dasiensis]|uniref:LADA_0G08108g1_1 n=1 Tax=Lachancea dasiensis TaxID=1072105 RepID=A0A1G4JTY8_9SACH|nr:LADA_0G08108g1_1 [Lachancea dasiensis]